MRIILMSAFVALSAFAQIGVAPRVSVAPAAAPRLAAPARSSGTAIKPRPLPSLPPIKRPVTNAPKPTTTYTGGNYPRTVVAPYPIFVGAGTNYVGDSGPVPTAVGMVNPSFQPDAVNPQIIDFSNAPIAAPAYPDADPDTSELRDDQPTVFLIALTDHTVLASIAYWAEDDTLNWVSRDAKQNRISLSLVDREFSKQLNDERHVEFKLPAAQ